jgi:hypothetical protein
MYVSVRGISVAVIEVFIHMGTHFPKDGYVPLQWQEFHDLLVL